MEKIYHIKCPHCDFEMEIEQLNCCIFRCGILKNIKLIKDNVCVNNFIADELLEEMIEQKILSINPQQIQPHLPQQECEFLKNNNLIYGCGKPFKITENGTKVEKCDYI